MSFGRVNFMEDSGPPPPPTPPYKVGPFTTDYAESTAAEIVDAAVDNATLIVGNFS